MGQLKIVARAALRRLAAVTLGNGRPRKFRPRPQSMMRVFSICGWIANMRDKTPGRKGISSISRPAMPRMRIVYEHDVEARIQAPSRDEVRVWIVPLDAISTCDEQFASVLTADERLRADRYKVEKARVQFVTGRGLLRRHLGKCLGVAASEVPITYTGAGKPVLPAGVGGIHFNVTHTDGLVLIALAGQPVGIDVEQYRTSPMRAGRSFLLGSGAGIVSRAPRDVANGGLLRGW